MSSSPSSAPPVLDLIKDYIAQKPNFTQYIKADDETTTTKLAAGTKNLSLNARDRKLRDRKESSVRYYLKLGLPVELAEQYAEKLEEKRLKRKLEKMPVHPAEENATGDITDQVAKESSDSTASTHPAHQKDTGATSGGSVGAQAHKANPGPVIAQDIGKPASKEELKKRSEELNK